MDDVTKARILADAQSKADLGKYRQALKVMRPLLDIGAPEALFLYSTFSLAGTESDVEFERRSLDLLTRAADSGYAPALYALGVCYEVGDLVAPDPDFAAALLRAAAERGYPKAKFRHGLNLFYGSNKMPRDEEYGLALIRNAAKLGVHDAVDFLKDEGLPID